jgi:hypothetical protein
MWIFTSTGFVSAVVHRDDPDRIVVRGRDLASLEPLIARTGAEVDPWRGSDYAHRIVVPRTEFTAWVAEQADAIDYTNFKSSAHRRRGGAFADVLHEVWSVMYAFQGRMRGGSDSVAVGDGA